MLTIIVSVVYLMIIIYIFLKYNMDEKPVKQYELYRDELEILPSESAYLLNKETNSMNLLLADILTLVNMGYIQMELINNETEQRDYKFTKVENKDMTLLKNHQATAYKLFFFDRDTLTLNEFLGNVRNDKDYNRETEIKYCAIKFALDKEFEKLSITDVEANRSLKKINTRSLQLIFASILPLIMTGIFVLTENKYKNIMITIISFIILSVLLYFSTKPNEVKITYYGADLKEKAKALNNYLQEYVIVEDKPLYMVNVLEYYYINAVAMGLVDMVNKKFTKEYLYANISNKLNDIKYL